MIDEHFHSYRELPPELGAVRVPHVITVDPDAPSVETELVEYSLADLLFDVGRAW